jgi:hypothetical protein
MLRGIGGNVVKVVLLAGAVALGGAVIWLTPANQAGPCTVLHRTMLLRELPEASGLAISRRHPGIIWSHNDSGNRTELFAVDAAGTLRGRVRVPVTTRDWEDISAARCPAGTCLYIADIGDNRLRRRDIHIYRVPEPALDDAETRAPEVFTGTYADGPHNAEALFIVGDKVFIILRERGTGVYRATLPPSAATAMTFERIGQLDLGGPVTDAEAAPDEASVAVRTSKLVVIYKTAELIKGGTTPAGLNIPIDGLKEPQGEGVALDTNGMLYLASEGQWLGAGRLVSLQCAFK